MTVAGVEFADSARVCAGELMVTSAAGDWGAIAAVTAPPALIVTVATTVGVASASDDTPLSVIEAAGAWMLIAPATGLL